ncbi:MAG: hypothetical protein ACE15C_14335 [Phycisphaerae bacterium]
MSEWEIVGICASMLTAAAAVVLGMLTFTRRRAADGRPGRPSGDSAGAGGISDDVRELMEQLERLAGQLDAKFDAKLDELRKALAEADVKIAEIRELVEREYRQDSPQLRGKRTLKIGQALGAEVARLGRTGMDAVEIASRLKIDVGEVELFLSLDRSQRLKQA